MASLASERVRLDFWRMLRSIWSETFGSAVRAAFSSARLLSFGEHGSLLPASDFTPSIQRAWSDGQTFGIFEVPDSGHLVTCIYLDPTTGDRELVLEFYFLDMNGRLDISDGLEIGPEWNNREGWRSTQSHVLGLSEGGRAVDLEPFDTLCRSAMTALAEVLATRSSAPQNVVNSATIKSQPSRNKVI